MSERSNNENLNFLKDNIDENKHLRKGKKKNTLCCPRLLCLLVSPEYSLIFLWAVGPILMDWRFQASFCLASKRLPDVLAIPGVYSGMCLLVVRKT